ncbi:MAG: hypothetical protein L0H53_04415 [Candidatus Nitrosocosmicus sp.]|nr:hypothetical protein [Candidatus Nitrosocosmicus sp.]MDN5866812.1 hypothetical protein [Candidatus Nitrosocosmicus sp.]
MKGYQKLTIITAILGLIIPFIGLFLYFLINSVVGIPILALFVGWALLIAIAIIGINVGAIIAAFKIKNTKIVGGILIACGVLLFALIQWFAVPALVLFVIAGILALREKNTPSNLKSDSFVP